MDSNLLIIHGTMNILQLTGWFLLTAVVIHILLCTSPVAAIAYTLPPGEFFSGRLKTPFSTSSMLKFRSRSCLDQVHKDMEVSTSFSPTGRAKMVSIFWIWCSFTRSIVCLRQRNPGALTRWTTYTQIVHNTNAVIT